jgi:hypothetical protein
MDRSSPSRDRAKNSPGRKEPNTEAILVGTEVVLV